MGTGVPGRSPSAAGLPASCSLYSYVLSPDSCLISSPKIKTFFLFLMLLFNLHGLRAIFSRAQSSNLLPLLGFLTVTEMCAVWTGLGVGSVYLKAFLLAEDTGGTESARSSAFLGVFSRWQAAPLQIRPATETQCLVRAVIPACHSSGFVPKSPPGPSFLVGPLLPSCVAS